jgi:alkanesulfonate monooxygenase SsuD/methylene tetrahydromethanopterin reductase-like flavin-dependent oxidoreductase (luciferase family)
MDPHSPHREIARKRELYRTQLEQAGHSFAGRRLPMARLVAVAETDAEAAATAKRGAQWTAGAYITAEALKQFAGPDARAASDPVEHYLRDVVVHGSPERVLAQLEQLREEMFLDYLLLAPLSEKSFQLFTDRVLPKLG